MIDTSVFFSLIATSVFSSLIVTSVFSTVYQCVGLLLDSKNICCLTTDWYDNYYILVKLSATLVLPLSMYFYLSLVVLKKKLSKNLSSQIHDKIHLSVNHITRLKSVECFKQMYFKCNRHARQCSLFHLLADVKN